MYEQFFSLDELPFDGLPDNRFYYVGNCQHEALELLTGNLSRNGCICVLSGPSGAGKTTLVRMLIRTLPKRMRIIAIDDPRLDPHMLLATILRASGVVATSFESIAELTLKLRKLLEHSVENGIVTTVICDEAQGLSDEVLEQIRLISNIEGQLGKMVNFLLVGQEDLISNLQKPMHKMFWGRVKAFASIKPLKRDEVQAYVNFRMQMAGCHDPVFTNRAIRAIYKDSGGLPRIINAIADRALCIAYEAKKKHVTVFTVKKAIEVVRRRRSLFVVGFKTFAKEFICTLFARIPVLLAGAAFSAAVFFLCYTYLPNAIKNESFYALVMKDRVVLDNYKKAMEAMLPGRNEKKREIALFEIAKKASVFKSDSLNTLVKLHGYQRRDGGKTSCDDLKKISLKCVTLQKDFDFIKKVNRPAIVSLRDDAMNPFYAVVHRIGTDDSDIILGDYMFTVKNSYLKHVYDGEFTYVGIGKGRDLGELNLDAKKYLEKLSFIAEDLKDFEIPKLPEKLTKDEAKKFIKTSYDDFKEKASDDLAYILFDNLQHKGPYLEGK
ncbi:MAG: ExeA family protein [Succinivibrio sp.]